VKLVWSNLARDDLRALSRYSVDRWGSDIAQRYLEDVRDCAKHLTAHPLLARPLRQSFRIFRVRSHYLIVHLDTAEQRLTIARVLHIAMAIERHLP
jgi:plasmid stabilization system protein ParE